MQGKTAEKSKFDVRATPRRRPKGCELDEQPVFLRKAFTMISSCPPEIGGWSENGSTVVIKDVKAFSETVIPTAYKHNNFSSFVRQLNFYGFRKVKSSALHGNQWWEFRHPSFVRGQPQLLCEIKRSVHFESGNIEVSDLRSQVSELNNRVNTLSDMLEQLNVKVTDTPLCPSSAVENRRKVRARTAPSEPMQETLSLDDPMLLIKEELLEEDSPRDTAFTLEGLESDFMNTLMEMEDPVEPVAIKEEKSAEESVCSTPVQASGTPATPSTNIAQDVATVLTVLTPEQQMRFVDKLAESMGIQLAAMFAQNNDKVSHLTLPSGSAPDIALPLASAAIGAFVMSSMAMGPGSVAAKKAPTVSA